MRHAAMSTSAPSSAVAPGPAAPGPPTRARVRRILVVIVLTILAALAAAALGLRVAVGRSLPALAGERRLPGLTAAVTVERDALGVPTIAGSTRGDVARALGFVHAQDRFFQMDLSRRRAAGELAELLGPAALAVDRATRLHRFRARAARVVAGADAADRALLDAYAQGVNEGLASLGARPFEYLVLRSRPAPWRTEDTVLVVASMFFQLQDASGLRDARMGLLFETLPGALVDFLTAPGSEWETPLFGGPFDPPVVPGPDVLDLHRRARPRAADAEIGPVPRVTVAEADPLDLGETWETARGSNSWAIAGARSATGAAILADDMHLGLGVPNTWYRASLSWTDAAAPGGRWRVTGVTLPGVPSIIVGSNGLVAWGFTNTTADWTDLVVIEVTADGAGYRAPGGSLPFAHTSERINVRGEAGEVLDVRETVWGPVIGADAQGRPRAVRWVPHDVEGLNVRFAAMETARCVEEAFAVGHRAGIPAQNLVVASRDGHIGWTIAGRIPRRVRVPGRVPLSWAEGTRGWDGWLDPAHYPRLIDPPSGLIVTANNRLVDGEALAAIGDGGYDQGARARQIRNALATLDRATIDDMLRVQLDDRALFLSRWRDLALEALTPRTLAARQERREFRDLVEGTWSGRASIDSVAYRLVRAFRLKTAELAFAPLIAPARLRDATFPPTLARAYEGPLWQLLKEQPAHLLDPRYASWHALLVDAIDQTIAAATEGQRPLRERTWGEVNTTRIGHPLGRALPWLTGWLGMSAEPLPGDAHMPRVQGADFGASERLAVSPGREPEGYFHMPGGQSGHPLSPHYRDGHAAWARGERTPFLPGPAMHRLTLTP